MGINFYFSVPVSLHAFTSSLSTANSGWTVSGKPKDKTTLDSDPAHGLTHKDVHKDLSKGLVKIENFWSITFE